MLGEELSVEKKQGLERAEQFYLKHRLSKNQIA
jgi:hypothetical protein